MNPPVTLSFDDFWRWLTRHSNCILRAGTPESVVYDDEDLHWHFAAEGPGQIVVQVIRGKRLIAEMFIGSDQITYVQEALGEKEEERVFELVSESQDERLALFFFVMAHPYEAEEKPTGRLH